jgi:HprK-related kinase A
MLPKQNPKPFPADCLLELGPFRLRIHADLPEVRAGLGLLYDPGCLVNGDFADYHVRLASPRGRRWLRPQAQFYFDGHTPFKPLPREQAYAMLEWGLNWTVAAHAHRFLMLHAAVLERHGHALVMPAPPGSGKSTLTAALSYRGWRLFSDEIALIDRRDGRLYPMPRPISLKNASIDVIRRFLPGCTLGPIAFDTAKGTVSHLKPERDSMLHMKQAAPPRWIAFPRWVAGAPATLTPIPRAQAFMRLAEQGFNYSLLGAAGFEALADLAAGCDIYDFRYGELSEALALFERHFVP